MGWDSGFGLVFSISMHACGVGGGGVPGFYPYHIQTDHLLGRGLSLGITHDWLQVFSAFRFHV